MREAELASAAARAGLGAAAVAAGALGALLWQAGIRRPDPWRRTLGLGLRSLECQFALSAFGLRPVLPGEVQAGGVKRAFVTKLVELLREEPWVRFALRHRGSVIERIAKPAVDVLLGHHASDGSLEGIEPFLDPAFPVSLPGTARREIEQAIIESFNATRSQPEVGRVREMTKRLFRRLSRSGSAAKDYAGRLLTSVGICFDNGAESRFAPPDFRRYRIMGSGFLQIFCHWRGPNRACDLWFHVHHTGADGAPVQEFISRLEQAWMAEPAVFPRPSDNAASEAGGAADAGNQELRLIQFFVDFASLLALRKRMTPNVAVPAGALFLWLLARQPEFAGVRFAVAVDVPADARFPRAVDLIGIRPADFAAASEHGNLEAFAGGFERLVAEARRRQSPTFRAMRNLALLPSWLAQPLMKSNRSAAAATFGSVGLSVLRDARIFVAPMADSGFEGGFIAIGGMNLASESGGMVGSVTIKGRAIGGYPAAIRRALASAASGVSR